jgi:hypothetical protein
MNKKKDETDENEIKSRAEAGGITAHEPKRSLDFPLFTSPPDFSFWHWSRLPSTRLFISFVRLLHLVL